MSTIRRHPRRAIAAAVTLALGAAGAVGIPAYRAAQASQPCTVGKSRIERCVPDPALAQIVANNLWKDTEDVLTQEDIDRTTSITAHAEAGTVGSLEGLALFHNLETLRLDGRALGSERLIAADGSGSSGASTDIDEDEVPVPTTPLQRIPDLSALPKLTTLELSHFQIGAIENLDALAGLTSLDLSHNRITAIQGLDALTTLTSLDLSNNLITTVEGLDALTDLDELNLSHNRITAVDSAAFAKLTKLGTRDADNIGPDAGLGSQVLPDHAVALDKDGRFQVKVPTLDGTPLRIDPFDGGTLSTSADRYRIGDDTVTFKYKGATRWVLGAKAIGGVPTGGKVMTFSVRINSVPRTTVTFDTDGAGEIPERSVVLGAAMFRPAPTFNPGHFLSAWIGPSGADIDFPRPVTGPTTIATRWRHPGEREFQVSFDSTGGSAVPTVTVEEGQPVPAPPKPSRDGNEFVAWTIAEGGQYDFDTPVHQDLELIATWTPKEAKAPEDAGQDVGPAPADPRFDLLHRAATRHDVDYKVVLLGSSSANGGNVTHREQGWSHRLGYALGGDVLDLDSTSVYGAGKHWYHGAQSGTKSEDYATPARLSQIAAIQPDYVIHQVGSNDWAANVDPAKYASNLRSIANQIAASSPHTIQVLIHQQPRADLVNRKYSWAQYGAAMQSVAADDPANRIFYDVNPALGYFDPANDRNLVAPDRIHLTDAGNRLMTSILSSFFGIPVETGAENEQESIVIGVEGRHSLKDAGASETLGQTTVKAATYPRMIHVTTTLATRSAGNADIVLSLGDSQTVLPIDHGQTRSDDLSGDWIYVPPGQELTATVSVTLHDGTVDVAAGHPYGWAAVEAKVV